jgi:uncharacterized protein Yka (UPF0111/DUF47 family)
MASSASSASTSDAVAIDNLTKGFVDTVHAPIVRTARNVDEAARALESVAASMSAGDNAGGADDEQAQLEKLSASMTRMTAYVAKTQRLARDMRAVREKTAQLRQRVEKIEQKQQAADAQMAEFARVDAAREASLEAQPAAATPAAQPR